MESPQIRQAQFDLFDTARFFELIEKVGLRERDFRLIVAAVAEAESSWNISYIADCANVSRSLIYDGISDLRDIQRDETPAGGRQRTQGHPHVGFGSWRRTKALHKTAVSSSAPCYNMGHE